VRPYLEVMRVAKQMRKKNGLSLNERYWEHIDG
jgi:hypothetical protein